MNTISNRKIKPFFIFLLLYQITLLSGCANMGAPSPNDINSAYFGEKPTREEAMSKINEYLNNSLFDPYSAKVDCNNPSGKVWVSPNRFMKPHYGYVVVCGVNAKNRMGGYTGKKDYWFIFNGSSSFKHLPMVNGKPYHAQFHPL